MPRASRTLQRILAVRVLLVSLSACIALAAFTLGSYLLDTPRLRRLTLENETRRIVAALAESRDPQFWPEFRDFPEHYGFRVYDHRAADRRKLVSEANAQLLLPLDASEDGNLESALSEGFGPLQAPGGEAVEDRWQATDHVDIAGHSYWVQVAMVGDPAWRWRGVIGEEMRDHVLVPVLFIIPALGLAMVLTATLSLRPLRRVAALAGSLDRALTQGAPLAPLPEDNLPLEIRAKVGAINAMLGRVERSFVLQKQFAADVAHELRTPLAVVLLEARRLSASPEREAITEELNALGALVNQLLRFAQVESLMAQERGELDLAAVARAVCENLAGTAVAHGIALEFDAPDAPVRLPGHAALIDSAIRNVMENAIRLAPAGSTVSVTVRGEGCVVVEDRGPGVADAQKELIFSRFWRADRSPGGAGIGLALVRRITRLHGGDARVEDRPGGGARFVLRFAAEP